MSRSSDAGHFFQTESSLTESARKERKSTNTYGDPINLDGKVLAVISDPREDDHVFVAESSGLAKRVCIFTKKTTHIYRGPAAPLTCLTVSPSGTIIVAGCWDKTIWSWDTSTCKQLVRYQGHADFIKAVVCGRLISPEGNGLQNDKNEDGTRRLDTDAYLISGSADTSIIVWQLHTAQKIHVIKNAHSRGILSLAIDPISYQDTPNPTSLQLFSGGSEGGIKRWLISLSSATALVDSKSNTEKPVSTEQNADQETIDVHATSVNQIYIPPSGAEDETNMFTASSDNNALVVTRMSGFKDVETTLVHPDFVRDVTVDNNTALIFTACRDENVRAWDSGTEKCIGVLEGHFEEVTGLCLVLTKHAESGKALQRLISVSIDGTVRRWPVGRPEIIETVKHIEEDKERLEKGEATNGTAQKGKKGPELTEDEERELAELMEEDD